MRVTRQQAEDNRRTILEAAGRSFRERGFDGVGVADLMKAAGFTHGGFYNHFASKDALAAEACADALGRANAALADELRAGEARPWKRYLTQYLSAEHRDDPAGGCTLAALAADAARSGAGVQTSFAAGIEQVIAILAAYLERTGEKPAAARARAIQTWSEAIGGLVLARALAAADPGLSEEILDANRRALVR